MLENTIKTSIFDMIDNDYSELASRDVFFIQTIKNDIETS